jgi:2-hydroxychromene-2-carboxylate isomerase
MGNADIHFYFDPVCPFAWMTSKWVRIVQSQRDYSVEWRFISLRLLNAHVDYDTQFPPEYEAGHTAGLRLLRVLSRARQEHGADAVSTLYAALGARIFDSVPTDQGPNDQDPTDQDATDQGLDPRGSTTFVEGVLQSAGLPVDLASALDDEAHDALIRAETDEALSLAGKDVGTPIIHFRPPEGTAFFGPVISRLPSEEDAVRLWDHVVGLATFAGFSELKRSLRELPQLRGLGVAEDEVGVVEDWHGGSRRQKR